MTDDYLAAAIDALNAATNAYSSIGKKPAYSEAYTNIGDQMAEAARTLALLSIAADLRRIADRLTTVVQEGK